MIPMPHLIIKNASSAVNKIVFYTDGTGSVTVTTRGPSETGFWLDWGDGSKEWVDHLGNGVSVNTVHDYLGLAGNKPIAFYGETKLITYLYLNVDSSFNGSIKGLSGLTGLTSLLVNSTSLSGDLSSVAGMKDLINLRIDATNISGNIASIGSLSSLLVFYGYSTDIEGDVYGLSGASSLTNLRLNGANVSGELGDLSTLDSLTFLALNNTDIVYETTSLPLWSNATLNLHDCEFTSGEVDNFLIDLAAAGGTGGTLKIDGTNAARTSASDAAVSTLLSNSWVVTVNE